MGVLENVLEGTANATVGAAQSVASPAVDILSLNGIIVLVIGTVLVIAAFYAVYKVLKNLVANAIIGGVGLIAMHFLFPLFLGLEVPISLLNIIVALLAGLPGLVIIVVFALFGVK
ncbi:MAG: pro-sigmaK processing inhibitor BofA family protein [Candidatus Diapherotrites archaeon]|nr:pro-sigmaK processing inhibitor BofA family protein [Candidatus Diapherotrites archaeon]